MRLGVPTAICTSIAGIVIIAGPASFFVELIFGLVALAGGVCTGLMVFLEPERKSTAHQTAADRYNSLKGRARRLYNVDVNREELTIEELSERLESLSKERDELNESGPIIPEGAYEKGKKGIEAGQAAYEVDRQ